MYRLHSRAVDEDFKLGPRQRQIRDPGGIELERHVGLRSPAAVALVEVGAQRSLHESQIRAQDPVFIQAGDGIESRAEQADELLSVAFRGTARVGDVRIEARLEQLDEVARDRRIRTERALHVRLAERDACL